MKWYARTIINRKRVWPRVFFFAPQNRELNIGADRYNAQSVFASDEDKPLIFPSSDLLT
jgi:hypothetical protein